MSRIIDFFKIIGAQSTEYAVTDDVSPEEQIRVFSNLTEEQKSILIDSLRENDRNANKLNEENKREDKVNNKYDIHEKNHEEKYIPVKNNIRKDYEKDERSE